MPALITMGVRRSPSVVLGESGRQETTPFLGVLYRSKETTMPEVEFACMRAFPPKGEQLPNQLNYPESSTAVKSVGSAVVIVVAGTFLQLLS